MNPGHKPSAENVLLVAILIFVFLTQTAFGQENKKDERLPLVQFDIPLIQFDEIELFTAIDLLAKQSGLKIKLDRKLIEPNPRITFRMQNVMANSLLEALLEHHGLLLKPLDEDTFGLELRKSPNLPVQGITAIELAKVFPEKNEDPLNDVRPRIELDETQIADAIRTLAKDANLNLLLDSKVQNSKDTINLRFENMKPTAALDMLLNNHGLMLIRVGQSNIGRVISSETLEISL